MPPMIAAAAIIVETQWAAAAAEPKFARDRLKTPSGDIEIAFIGHGTLMLQFGGKTIHIDPWTRLADYAKLPKADLILIMRDQGKIRFVGITEAFELDPGHTMLQDALRDDCWDVMMVGFNLLNQTARQLVFPQTIQRNIGTLIYPAVRGRTLHVRGTPRPVPSRAPSGGRFRPASAGSHRRAPRGAAYTTTGRWKRTTPWASSCIPRAR